MTSEERRDIRYHRRKEKRYNKKIERNRYYDNFEKVFTCGNLRKSFKKCKKGVMWKGSVQRYYIRSPIIISETMRKLIEGKYKHSGFDEFDLFERGKLRHIKAIKFKDRIVQRCFCDNCLSPVIERSLIYDNGASQMYKGYHFSIRRMICHLQRHYRKYGNKGYIMLFDFSKFFDSVDHNVIRNILRNELSDKRLVEYFDRFISSFGDVGLGLGSQISQVMALSSANRLDHYCKDVLGIKGYCRYMDDGYLISESKEVLQKALVEVRRIAEDLGFNLNERKTRIVKLSRTFSWMKVRWCLTDTGKVIHKIYKNSVTRMRRKLKKFPKLIERGILDVDHAVSAYQSWRGYAKNFQAYYNIRKMDALFNRIFPEIQITRGIKRKIDSHANYILGKIRHTITLVNTGQIPSEREWYIRKAWARDAKKFEQQYNTVGNEAWEKAKKELSKERKVA